jgi:hypothetical protein
MGLGVVMAAAGSASADFFTPGDLLVLTYGSSGSTTADGASTPLTLQEFATTGGSPVLSYTLPTADGVGGSSNVGVVGEYGSSSEGNIQLSGNGLYLTFAGYSATAAAGGIQASTNTANGTNFTPGTAFAHSTVSLAQATDTNVPRVGILVNSNGVVNSSTVLNDVYNTNNPRSTFSANGTTTYFSGQGDGNASNQGLFLTATGTNTVSSPGSTPTAIYTSAATKVVTAFNGNLYVSSSNGVSKFNGIPTGATSTSAVTPASNGFSGAQAVTYAPEGFFFANANTLYVADTGKSSSVGDGGIQKWTSTNGTTWTLDYTLTPTSSGWIAPGNPGNATSGETGFEAITGQVIGSTVNLYAVSYTLGDANPDGLYTITDTLNAISGTGESFVKLESAAGNGGEVFKGVSFAPLPEPTTLAPLGVCGFLLMRRRRSRRGVQQ